MNTGKTLFAQLMDFLPWTTFARIVKRYGGDRYVKSQRKAYRIMRLNQQILRLFSLAERHKLTQGGHTIQVFEAELTPLQHQVLALLGVSEWAYRAKN